MIRKLIAVALIFALWPMPMKAGIVDKVKGLFDDDEVVTGPMYMEHEDLGDKSMNAVMAAYEQIQHDMHEVNEYGEQVPSSRACAYAGVAVIFGPGRWMMLGQEGGAAVAELAARESMTVQRAVQDVAEQAFTKLDTFGDEFSELVMRGRENETLAQRAITLRDDIIQGLKKNDDLIRKYSKEGVDELCSALYHQGDFIIQGSVSKSVQYAKKFRLTPQGFYNMGFQRLAVDLGSHAVGDGSRFLGWLVQNFDSPALSALRKRYAKVMVKAVGGASKRSAGKILTRICGKLGTKALKFFGGVFTFVGFEIAASNRAEAETMDDASEKNIITFLDWSKDWSPSRIEGFLLQGSAQRVALRENILVLNYVMSEQVK
ncbi:hypothetical protein ACFL6Y_08990 [Elusimicrobiota bacterium]